MDLAAEFYNQTIDEDERHDGLEAAVEATVQFLNKCWCKYREPYVPTVLSVLWQTMLRRVYKKEIMKQLGLVIKEDAIGNIFWSVLKKMLLATYLATGMGMFSSDCSGSNMQNCK
ncbi:uncharacterized protein LOC124707193 [Lolium rigidum]|uniref:uncharacterized protein LOC124707193 n=1 Tax=Lolium rigidum TaxID=89674 RepID=UPI001F5C9088|nr:uncharacterized protein LOC124707193 [Lolium rigidum]XP_047094806.1 uncharacterized protein LOC124707193 [Lolium rigidum]XP_047094807.1 uncharacterized protein LOC124707193 [Lolium rigidum]XP_047094809.1 uncharacterized protein LOC124707193 [Lolium rigidum]XP_047094810.1 uncharacterized protein LOC124707193 [Lolium rigidum]XP_047094811.1 uncharacterized protein LOC124707193 [Lolium rigidum]